MSIVLAIVAFVLLVFSAILLSKCLGYKTSLASAEDSLRENTKELKKSLVEIESGRSLLDSEKKKANDQIKKLETEMKLLESESKALKEKEEQNMKQIEILKQQLNSNSSFDGLFPICSSCKDIRDPKGYWHTIEDYIQGLSDAELSHSLCPNCAKKLYPDLFNEEGKTFCLKWRPPQKKEK